MSYLLPGYPVTCAICERRWSERDPGVTYSEGMWWCADEAACFERHATVVTEFGELMADWARQLRDLEVRDT